MLITSVTLTGIGPAADLPEPQGKILSTENSVDFTRSRTNWEPAVVGQPLVVADRLRTMTLSRAMLQLAELGRLRVNELTTVEVLPPRASGGKAVLDLKSGAMYFFSRDKPLEFQIQTPPQTLAASRGTEFLVTIEPGGRVVFTVFDGEIELSNPFGPALVLTNGEQGAAIAGQAPFKLAAIQAVNVVQWWLYYPGVLDLNEIPLTAAEQAALAAPLAGYRQGDLVGAINNYPDGRVPQSDAEKAFYAALLLAVGQVDKADSQLATITTQPTLVNALKEIIAAVSLTNFPSAKGPSSASEWLAHSYSQQARFDLPGALASARAAATNSPEFGFAWERVAELEFSFGHTDESMKALDAALRLSPRNAQAWALKGFLAAAKNDLKAATNYFQTAIDLDRALGNGWLGRGLVRIRLGDQEGGRFDLQTAAAMEPNRSLLRSYLGKAFDSLNEVTNAAKELRLAKRLDPADPTPWLYSALLLRQQLRFNEAIGDLEKSLVLNTNRAVYRSRLLLDEDHAVRSSSLATIYRSAGMTEVSVREAARAVAADYGNPSAHLFLAESFDALRDPTRFNLRIETAWFNELLLANLLAPVGGGNLSQNISQQEYSRLFEGNRLGLSTFSEYRGDGQYRELASQFGTYRNTSYALDLDYQHNDGVRPNNALDRIEWYTTLKHQITPQDSVLLLMKYQDYHSGDNFQYYDPKAVTRAPLFYQTAYGITNLLTYRPHFQFDETQHPLVVAGIHHEWAPGVHSLLLGGRLDNDQRFSDRQTFQRVLTKSTNGVVGSVNQVPMDVAYRSELEIYTGEFNQIIQRERFNVVVGARFQTGDFTTKDQLTLPAKLQQSFLRDLFQKPPTADSFTDDFERIAGYGYYTLRVSDDLYATAGVAYDQITLPANFRTVPISSGSTTRDQVGPKGAIVWAPASQFTLRGIYAQALGGVSLDESFRLEPVQLAGFNQAFRSLPSESIPGVGAVTAPGYEVWGLAADMKFGTRTYVGWQGEILNAAVRRQVGVFDYYAQRSLPAIPSHTPERLDYDERSLALSVNQLVSDEWSVGASYRFTQSELDDSFPLIRPTLPITNPHQRANLHEGRLFVLYNHPCGFFAQTETLWFHQDTFDHAPKLDPEDFFQQNLFVGWRLRRQRGEVSVGVLNLNDTDYRLNPLNLYAELPRERIFVARLKFNL